MSTWTFFATLMAVNIVMHLLRLPHLILENGGGAFVLLFVLVLHIVALPLLLVEIALAKNRKKTSLKDVLVLKKASGSSSLSISTVKLIHFLRIIMLFMLSMFFIYSLLVTTLHIIQYVVLSVSSEVTPMEIKDYPSLFYNLWGCLIVTLLCYKVAKSYYVTFVEKLSRWLLPFCFAVFIIVCSKILLSLNDLRGIKVLFYPDFSQLSSKSLLLAIGHALICMFISFGFFSQSLLLKKQKDSIRLIIHAVLQSVFVTLFVGVLALPTIQQASQSSFGASWIFTILPRWLSYGSYGYYYCFLFYLSLGIVFFYLMVFAMKKTMDAVKKFSSHKWVDEAVAVAMCISVSLGLVLFYQQPLKNWWGQGIYLVLGDFYVNFLLPLLVCGMIWMMFTQTKKEERQDLFKHQQVFFHNTYFFRVWENVARYVVPGLILAAWLLYFLFPSS